MKQAKDYLIFPLDVPSLNQATQYVEMLADHVGIFKVGLELFIQAGPEILSRIKKISETAGVFLDLKLHDIPETVFRAMKRIASLDVTYATVHCGESIGMLEAAVKGAEGNVKVLGVTVLTSIGGQDIRSAGYSETFAADIHKLVLFKAKMAKAAGCAGVISSGKEAHQIKKSCGKDFLAITPGIRPAWEGAPQDDQKRVMTPAEAIQNGADHLVIGRPIRDAKDPAIAAANVVREIEAALAMV